ncbi:tRNA modification GTPase [Lyticum sinuosum]|uniref:tRNA modification GTPase MnmE n=1 Tax=Lyticum sinuosum TaxID=1332059 RepID=A0AAE4VJN8_9RICK|nr:GTPase [Lyticum sinuosum]MDZ5761260.1 tRNA modification GTPase MnmE [Lyticum sinuosum]
MNLYYNKSKKFTVKDNNETIYALSTPYGKSAIAAIRISSPNQEEISDLINILFDCDISSFVDRRAYVKEIYDIISTENHCIYDSTDNSSSSSSSIDMMNDHTLHDNNHLNIYDSTDNSSSSSSIDMINDHTLHDNNHLNIYDSTDNSSSSSSIDMMNDHTLHDNNHLNIYDSADNSSSSSSIDMMNDHTLHDNNHLNIYDSTDNSRSSSSIDMINDHTLHDDNNHLNKQHFIIDRVVVIYFIAPNSFTGEHMLEIFPHGGIAIIDSILERLNNIEFIRHAKNGEFSYRAFSNGKMNLLEVEALNALISAETSHQRKLVQQQLNNITNKSLPYYSWRMELVSIMAQLEAYIDFPDDEIPHSVLLNSQNEIDNLKDSIKNYLYSNNKSINLIEGIKIAILGPPNAGKSTILNILAGDDIAIVSDIAGTTRDTIKIRLNIGGFLVLLTDTAGIRDQTDDVIENHGIKRSYKAADDADIIIIVIDQSEDIYSQIDMLLNILSINKPKIFILNKVDLFPSNSILNLLNIDFLSQDITNTKNKKDLNINYDNLLSLINNNFDINLNIIKNKLKNTIISRIKSKINPDLENLSEIVKNIDTLINSMDIILFSMKSHIISDTENYLIKNNNIENFTIILFNIIENIIKKSMNQISEVFPVNQRQRQCIEECLINLEKFSLQKSLELSAQDIRFAINELSILFGEIKLDEILDVVFKEFCIGK